MEFVFTIKKNLHVDVIINGKSTMWQPVESGIRNINLKNRGKVLIKVIGKTVPSICAEYYTKYNGRLYFLGCHIRDVFERKNTYRKFTHEIFSNFPPYPTWIIEYDGGEMKLLEFYIDNNGE